MNADPPQYAFPIDPPAPARGRDWFTHSHSAKLPNEAELVNEEPVLRMKKYKMQPNERQAYILTDWIKIYNFVYNKALKYIKKNGYNANKNALRNAVKAEFNPQFKTQIKRSKIRAHTVADAIFDAHKAYKTSFALARVTGRPFRVRYRKTNSQAAIQIEKSAFGAKGMAYTVLGSMNLGIVPRTIKHDCRLKKERDGFYLYVPESKYKRENTKVAECGIDPGLRTFQTIYEPSGRTLESGTNYRERILPILRKIDAADALRQMRPKIRRYIHRLWDKIKSLTDDMHFKTISWLTNNYKKIYIGNMSTGSIVKKPTLSAVNKVLILQQSHFTFRQRLIAASEEKNCECIVVDEAYTSKMCGNCRRLHPDLGKAKRYVCPFCNYNADRDGNGARNILIKGKHGN